MANRSLAPPPTTPVKRAYEQVAAQIRQWIVVGVFSVGDKLPTEAELCRQFGTSRSTVREALRQLAAERLVVTQPGAHGGSVVSRPSVAGVTEDFTTSLGVLVGSRDLSVSEMVEARRIMEVPAAGLAARNRTQEQLDRLTALVPAEIPPIDDLLGINMAFHHTLLDATGNRLLPIVAIPVFEASARRVPRERLDSGMWQRVVAEHGAILNAVRSRDVTGAEEAMRLHLQGLTESYEDAQAAAMGSSL